MFIAHITLPFDMILMTAQTQTCTADRFGCISSRGPYALCFGETEIKAFTAGTTLVFFLFFTLRDDTPIYLLSSVMVWRK